MAWTDTRTPEQIAADRARAFLRYGKCDSCGEPKGAHLVTCRAGTREERRFERGGYRRRYTR